MMQLLFDFIRNLFSRKQTETAPNVGKTSSAEQNQAAPVHNEPSIRASHNATEPHRTAVSVLTAVKASRDCHPGRSELPTISDYYKSLGPSGFVQEVRSLLVALGYQVAAGLSDNSLLASFEGKNYFVYLLPDAKSLSHAMERGFGIRQLDAASQAASAQPGAELMVFTAGRVTKSLPEEARRRRQVVIEGRTLMRLFVANNIVQPAGEQLGERLLAGAAC